MLRLIRRLASNKGAPSASAQRPAAHCKHRPALCCSCPLAGLHSKLLVRGDARAAYHNNVLQATAAEVRAAAPDAGLRLETVGEQRRGAAADACPPVCSADAPWPPARRPCSILAAADRLPDVRMCTLQSSPITTPLPYRSAGGGRIEHYPSQRIIAVYGYSAAFGQAPHHVTAALLRRWLPFHDITASYDGY